MKSWTARRWSLLATMLLGQPAFCSESTKAARVLKSHEMRIGDSLPGMELPCSDGTIRSIGAFGSQQLITFSTPADCSECDEHILGLEQLLMVESITAETFFVTWTSAAERASAQLLYATRYQRPVCFDTAAVLWMRPGVSNTPFTVLLREGNVVYMNDLPLRSNSASVSLLEDLRRHGAVAR